MRPGTLAVLAAVGLAVAAPVAIAGQQSTTIGTGAKTCVLKPGADCRGVVHRWTVEHHGNLRKAKFTGAHLHGADFRGADLRGADFRGAKLRHADLRGANLTGARLHVPPKARKQANQTPSCAPTCPGADLSHANLRSAILPGANLSSANLSYADLRSANLSNAYLNGANLVSADLSNAILDGANLDASSLYYANFYQASVHNMTLGNSTVGWGQANWDGARWCSTVTPQYKLPISSGKNYDGGTDGDNFGTTPGVWCAPEQLK